MDETENKFLELVRDASVDMLLDLHEIVYGCSGSRQTARKKLKKFAGLNQNETDTLIANAVNKVPKDKVLNICDALELQFEESSQVSDIIRNILEYVTNISQITDSNKTKETAQASVSVNSAFGTAPSPNKRLPAKDMLLAKELELIELQFEVESCADNVNKEHKQRRCAMLEKQIQLIKNNLNSDVQEINKGVVQVDLEAEDHTSKKPNFTEDTVALQQCINKMISRQAIGDALMNFDGSESLQWPIFLSQYHLSNETCQFSPAENVLRLNRCLSGDAKKEVEMLLLTAKDPDAILDILNQKYGSKDSIVKALRMKCKDIRGTVTWDTFSSFNSAVRNIAGAAENVKADILAQKEVLTELIQKLEPHLVTQWGLYLVNKEVPEHEETLKIFSDWVREMTVMANRLRTPTNSHEFTNKDNQQASSNTNKVRSKPPNVIQSRVCVVCKNGEHKVEFCQVFTTYNVQRRWKIAEKEKLCYCCLQKHYGPCKNRNVCGIQSCSKYHHKLLHKYANQVNEVSTCMTKTNSTSLLKIVEVQLIGATGECNTLALLDEGSTTTLLDSSIAAKIGLEGPESPLCCKWTGDVYRYEHNSKTVNAHIKGTLNNNVYEIKNIRTMNDLDLPKQNITIDEIASQFPHVKKVQLTNTSNRKPMLLIGQDNAHLIVSRQVIQPTITSPIMSHTNLGWTLHGPISNCAESVVETFTCCEVKDERLHEAVKSYFRLESFGAVTIKQDKQESQNDQAAIEKAESTIMKIGKRYEIGLPWIENNICLPNSKPMALQRLKCLERKLLGDNQLRVAYELEIQKLLDKGYACETNPEDIEKANKVWYLPHFGVRNPNKPEKLRIVFDAAARVGKVSLNDFILTGPDWLTDLFGILIQFRQHVIAFTADICEMFNRVQMKDEDSFAQCFLWKNIGTDENPKTYRMKAMLFGMKSSPFLAQFVKNHNALQYQSQFPEACDAIIKHHYVDDYVHGTSSSESAINLIKQVILIHEEAGFVLRNFISNSKTVLDSIPPTHRANATLTSFDTHFEDNKVLGIHWCSQTDTLKFTIQFHKVQESVMNGKKVPTKREVLSAAMSIFDPLGLLSPITIRSRILLQQIWRSGIGWDDAITDKMFQKWTEWLHYLSKIKDIEIPRCYSTRSDSANNIQLHIFCDASEETYVAVVYLRFEYANSVDTSLLASKARVAPLKTLTIPKLELLAAVLGSRLANEVVKHLNLKISKRFFWTDSKTVLQWLVSEKKLQTFVAARVGEILQLSDVSEWKWVPSKDNTADDCTRSSTKILLTSDHRWFTGPDFLKKSETDWGNNIQPKIQECTQEITAEHVMMIRVEKDIPLPQIHTHYTWVKLLRVTSWLKRFMDNSRTKKSERRTGPLTTQEMKWSEEKWLRAVQQECFPNDLFNISHGRNNKNGRLTKMSLNIDNKGILRLSSRIKRIAAEDYGDDPIVLDGNHPYVQLYLMHQHKRFAHQGTCTVLNEVQRNFYIPKLRGTVKKVLHKCFTCKKRKAQPAMPKAGLLPEERLLQNKKAFYATGIDYFGPYMVKMGRKILKRYGVMFTCLTTRAVHVEIAHSLDTDSCIMAIRRMMARRGEVCIMMSDNGTNLRGASRELIKAYEEVDEKALQNAMVNRGINWKFIPPGAPHMGGSWERMIGCFKRALEAILKDRHPTDEVLLTVFSEVEHILNCRPLTYVSTDSSDPRSISPNDILIGQPVVNIPPGVFEQRDELLKKQWRVAQYLVDIFWKRWLREYIPTLKLCLCPKTNVGNLKRGDLVILEDFTTNRGQWPLAVVEKTFPGPDGIVRVAEVRTSSGTFRRPVSKLHLLEGCVDKESTPGGRMS